MNVLDFADLSYTGRAAGRHRLHTRACPREPYAFHLASVVEDWRSLFYRDADATRPPAAGPARAARAATKALAAAPDRRAGGSSRHVLKQLKQERSMTKSAGVVNGATSYAVVRAL